MATNAVFKAILRNDGSFVAALAVIPDGEARFFVVQRDEDAEAFTGRISTWVKAQGAEGMQMSEPEVLMEGIEVGEVVMRIKLKLGLARQADAPDYAVDNVSLEWSDAVAKASN